MERPSDSHLLAEFHRLFDVFDTVLDILCELSVDWNARRHYVTSRAQTLAWVDEGKCSLSEILSGTQDALDDAISEFDFTRPDYNPEGAALLARYSEITQQNFFDDLKPRAWANLND